MNDQANAAAPAAEAQAPAEPQQAEPQQAEPQQAVQPPKAEAKPKPARLTDEDLEYAAAVPVKQAGASTEEARAAVKNQPPAKVRELVDAGRRGDLARVGELLAG